MVWSYRWMGVGWHGERSEQSSAEVYWESHPLADTLGIVDKIYLTGDMKPNPDKPELNIDD